MTSQTSVIKVYLWKPRLPNVGHLSMQLSNGTYVSFWPDVGVGMQDAMRKQRSAACPSYADDVRSEGNHQADEVLELPKDIVDEAKINSWWSDYINKNKYNLLRKNCALAVREALLVGGIYQSPYVGEGGSNSLGLMFTPVEIFEWIKDCKALHPQKQNNSIAAKVVRGVAGYFSGGPN